MKSEQQARRVIGLDAHPYLFSAAALTGTDALDCDVAWVLDRQPLERLEAALRPRLKPGDVVVLEASGNSFAIAARLEALGVMALVLESQSVGQVGKTYCATDKVDAVKIARVYLSGLARVVWCPDPQSGARRELFFGYRNARRDAVRYRNQIWAWCNAHGLRRPKGLRLTHPAGRERLLALRPWSNWQRTLLDGMLDGLVAAERRRQHLERLITEAVVADPKVLQLVRLLGIRQHVAFALAAFIGPIERFATPKKRVAFFGLNPCVNTSGIGGGNGSLAHYGRSDVRALLIQAAHSILRYGQGQLHRWAIALKMRKGTNLAVAAVARKLVVAVWYLMRGGFTPLSEVSETLTTKLHKLATTIGASRVRELGFQNGQAFEAYMLQTIKGT